MREILFALTLCCAVASGAWAQTPDRFHVNVQPGDRARAVLEALRFVSMMAPDTLGVAGCALDAALGMEESSVARAAVADRISSLNAGCDPRSFQVRYRPVIYVEKLTEIKSTSTLPIFEQVTYEITLQLIRGEVQEWQVIKVRPSQLEMADNTIKKWRVVRFEVTRYLQTYFKVMGK